LEEVLEEQRKANVTCICKKGGKEGLGNYRPFNLISILGMVVEQLILGTIFRHGKDKKSIRSSWHGFIRGKPCLTNLINFYDEITGLVDEERAVNIVYLDFGKTFTLCPFTSSQISWCSMGWMSRQ